MGKLYRAGRAAARLRRPEGASMSGFRGVPGAAGLAAIAIASSVGLAEAATTTNQIMLDGVYTPGDVGYDRQYRFTLEGRNTDGSPTGETFEAVFLAGFGDNAATATVEDDLFIYAEIPLGVNDMTWENNEHPSWKPPKNKNYKRDFATATASEFFQLDFTDAGGATNPVNITLAANAGSHIAANGGGSVINAKSSLAYNRAQFPDNDSTSPLGDGTGPQLFDSATAQSPELDLTGCDQAALADCNIYKVADSAFDSWYFKQAFEFQITGSAVHSSVRADFSNLQNYLGGVLVHASPGKGEADDYFGVCFDTASCLEEPPGTVPLPAALPLMLAGLGGLVLLRRRGG